MNRIADWAESTKQHEGYYPGSRSYRNHNPGNFRCSSLVMGELGAIRCEDNFAVFPDFETGFKALCQFLTYACEGKLRSYKPEMTLYEFYSVYAPSGDGNYPRGYAEAVAKDLGIPATTRIKELLGVKPVSEESPCFHRFGHLQDVFVKEGDRVKAGQKIGTVGTGNGQFSGHLHYDLPTKTLSPWTSYVFGMSKGEVALLYNDPKPYRTIVLPSFDHFGWQYLELATYGSKKCYHPGEDLNGKGAGNSDVGDPIYSPVEGKVVYCYAGSGKNGGWGKLVVIEEGSNKPQTETQSDIIAVETPKTENSTNIPPEPTQSVESGNDNPIIENNPMEAKKWYLSKTMIVAIVTAVVGILTVFVGENPAAGWAVTALGVLNMVLRVLTGTPVKL